VKNLRPSLSGNRSLPSLRTTAKNGPGVYRVKNQLKIAHRALCELVPYARGADPRFADVTVKRWQDFTGLNGVLEGDGRTFAEVQAWRAQDASQPPLP
jgi:hypothetical protein